MKFNQSIQIGNFVIDSTSPTFLIGEAGVNHGGDIEVAKKLVDIAADAGVDAVKFQAFRTKDLILNSVEKAPYQKNTTEKGESQADMLQKLELSMQHYSTLKDYCEKKGLVFLITPFDEGSLEELELVGVDAYKIASTDTTNLPFLKKVAKTGKPILLSTGMSYLDEVKAALKEIHPLNQNVILLQCTANYPLNDNEANLNVINTYKKEFNIITGYSDHTVGVGASIYSIPMGAKVVEKHFTISKDLDGPDHLASLDPQELKQMVKEVRKIELFLGSYEKVPTHSELQTRKSLQKCLVAKTPIKLGEAFTELNVVAKRTGGIGISPIHFHDLLAQKASRNYTIDEIIEEEL